jgi:hypothetical protein
MKYILTLLSLFSVSFIFAQANYHKGSFVDHNGQTKQGYINYREWKQNPKYIEFKTSVDDVKAQIVYPQSATSFVVDGFEQYYTYTGKISLNKTNFTDLNESRDTTTRYGVFFFKLITTGDKLSLYTYTDSLKTRYFLQEKHEQPFELRYQQYYIDQKASTRVEATYQQQLSMLIDKYSPANTNLLNRLRGLNYEEYDIETIVNGINGNTAKAKAKHEGTVRFYAGAGLNINRSHFYGVDEFTANTTSSSLAPKLSIGIDAFANPNVQKIILRLDVSFSYLNAEFKNTRLPQLYSYKQTSVSITPQIIWNVYNTDSFKFYIDGGAAINMSNYTNAKLSPAAGSTGPVIDNPYRLAPVWISLPVQTGVVLNKKLELFVSYTWPAAYTANENDFSISSEIISAGIHLLLGKN